MRKIFEFKVFDILKDKDNEKFLDKIKKENPYLYSKFLNIIGNKGLDVAKEKYKEFDPEYIKKQRDIEKRMTSAEKKKIREENEENNKNVILQKNKNLIEEIENVILMSDIYYLTNIISHDKNIQKYLNSCKVKNKYENNFDKILKKSSTSIKYELINSSILLETIYYNAKSFLNYFSNENKNIIVLNHSYNTSEKKSYFSINVDLYDEIYLSVDANKEEDFLIERSRYVSKNVNKFKVSKEEIIDSIIKLSKTMSDEVYNDWYKIWQLKNDVEKYNL